MTVQPRALEFKGIRIVAGRDRLPPQSEAASRSTAPRLSRPRLLAEAARAGAALYRRERDLPAGLGNAARHIVAALTAAEAACDADRRSGSPAYSPARHVRLLSALIAEVAQAAP
jgi:hypothetical protein